MDPILIIFIALSAFIVYRLVSVLGARTGHERRRDVEGLQRARRRSEPAEEEERATPPAPTVVSAAAQPLREADPSFKEAEFLGGARTAYEMVVEAFASGDLKNIRRYLSPSVYDAFKSAVAAREAEGRTQDLKFVGIENASIASSEVADKELLAVVDFVSNQVRATYGKDGAILDGDPNRIDLVRDRWTFSRNVRTNDPNWTLVATGGA